MEDTFTKNLNVTFALIAGNAEKAEQILNTIPIIQLPTIRKRSKWLLIHGIRIGLTPSQQQALSDKIDLINKILQNQ